MSLTGLNWKRFLAAGVLCGLAWTGAFAQRRLEGKVKGEGHTRIKIAVPQPHTDGTDPEIARSMVETLRDDLALTGARAISPAPLPPSPKRLVASPGAILTYTFKVGMMEI